MFIECIMLTDQALLEKEATWQMKEQAQAAQIDAFRRELAGLRLKMDNDEAARR